MIFIIPALKTCVSNLWLIYGNPPQSEQEVVISAFEFENLMPPPQNVITTDSPGNLQVLPNPCNESFRISFEPNIDAHFQLFDRMGNSVMIRTINSGEILKTSELSSGIYFIKLSINNISYSEKILVYH
jgi:hypothetical protein